MIEVRAMKLDIDSIKKGDKNALDLNFALDLNTIDYYGDIIDIISPVDANGKLYVIDDRLYMNLEIKTHMQVNCSRCLESFTYPFKSSINAEFVHENLSTDQTDESDEDIIYYQESTIDLDELIKENIIMNIPMKLVCDKSCQGLCSNCGIKLKDKSCDCSHTQSIDEDVDPRLAKLKELLEQD
ncbi:YceD family protein [Alkaliphilus sp. B6464]|uniref:YceD family protein n=1 Tax=Alkaliphilus sp. B6464 TaxID=2731219 RepID=UPI001BA8E659|nr:YceD family protein [Alkaliphilus sp. B6464]QUH20871.1 DUF177 domain-containing protein [Alkaliphilus sp. B6464]